MLGETGEGTILGDGMTNGEGDTPLLLGDGLDFSGDGVTIEGEGFNTTLEQLQKQSQVTLFIVLFGSTSPCAKCAFNAADGISIKTNGFVPFGV
jgi:hypothetical protein